MRRGVLTLASLFLGLAAAGGDRVLADPVTGKPVRYAGKFSSATVTLPESYRPKAVELRGAWVATVGNIDFPKSADAETFKKNYIAVVENLKKANFNAIFFQVRPMCDAFYPSRHNPWSRWLTGTEGKSLGNFDPLDFMVREAQRRGLEFHAWLNPYRVIGSTPQKKEAYLATLAPDSFARRHPGMVLECPLGKDGAGKECYLHFLNPGEPAVVGHVVETVREILARYPVDAIHFDDYFYPYTTMGNIDRESYRNHNSGNLSLENWRRTNVNLLVKSVRDSITRHNRQSGRRVAFGISPFGIWANRSRQELGSPTGGKESFFAQYADTRSWVRWGWVDYIVPQIYWPFSHETAAYAALVDWWCGVVKGTKVNLYIGHAVYRLGEEQRWQARELGDQLNFNSIRPGVQGSVFFSYRSVFNPASGAMKTGVGQVLKEHWSRPASRPACRNIGE